LALLVQQGPPCGVGGLPMVRAAKSECRNLKSEIEISENYRIGCF
jgi:hypothetical protein